MVRGLTTNMFMCRLVKTPTHLNVNKLYCYVLKKWQTTKTVRNKLLKLLLNNMWSNKMFSQINVTYLDSRIPTCLCRHDSCLRHRHKFRLLIIRPTNSEPTYH